MLQIIGIIVLALLGGWLYRKGGAHNSNTKWRDVGVALVAVITMWGLGIRDWTLLASGLLLFAALTTYWDSLNKYLKRDQHEFWFNWLLTAFAYNASTIVTAGSHGLWKGFWIRAIVLMVLFVGSDFLIDWFHANVKALPDKAIPKEYCRGFFTIVTLPLLFIGRSTP